MTLKRSSFHIEAAVNISRANKFQDAELWSLEIRFISGFGIGSISAFAAQRNAVSGSRGSWEFIAIAMTAERLVIKFRIAYGKVAFITTSISSKVERLWKSIKCECCVISEVRLCFHFVYCHRLAFFWAMSQCRLRATVSLLEDICWLISLNYACDKPLQTSEQRFLLYYCLPIPTGNAPSRKLSGNFQTELKNFTKFYGKELSLSELSKSSRNCEFRKQGGSLFRRDENCRLSSWRELSSVTRTSRIFFSLGEIQLRRQKTCKVKKFSKVLLWMNFQLKYFNFLVLRSFINSWAKNVTHSVDGKKNEVRNVGVRERQMYFSISRRAALCKTRSKKSLDRNTSSLARNLCQVRTRCVIAFMSLYPRQRRDL